MPDRTRKLLADIMGAATRIRSFVGAATLADYSSSPLLRSAVERQIEIVGEALRRLEAADPAAVARISEYRRIISFRNILAHGYDIVDDNIVWQVNQEKLPTLLAEAAVLMNDHQRSSEP